MTEQIKATRQFKSDFDLVCRKYRCTESEIAEMKQLAREHLADAVKSFGLMAKEIVG